MGTYFGGKINWLGPKKQVLTKRRAPDLENQESGLFRDPRYSSPTQRFNLLQMSPNWFLRNWTLDPHPKVGLNCVVPFTSLSKLQLWSNAAPKPLR
jgi:hypothetical protein